MMTNVSWAPNQHFRMISEGSCDKEEWSSGYWKCSFAISGIKSILKHTKIEKIVDCNCVCFTINRPKTFEQYCVAEVLHQCDFVGLPTGGGAAGGAVFAGQEAGAVETGRGGFES